MGILGFYSVKKSNLSPKWIYIWYGISGLAFLSSFYNLLEGNFPLTALSFINATLFLWATYIIHPKAAQQKSAGRPSL
jgi:hypothetical protein